ncbi:hypothetical protein C7M84_004160 [Penaeus vannamei]|uniref:Tudor domain-containing protein 5 n=1 Tax=Penaeus vannamei TaxID=6689 RepID=A0A423UB30_PENVA|nr:hypothetical protein C7M84_004160 [Penaeus vannamei]
MRTGKVLPSDVKNCIKQLIASYPDGLQLEKLNHTYWQMYGKRLMPFEYGFKDVVDMVLSLAGDVWVEEGAQGQVFLKVNRGEGDALLQEPPPSRIPMALREIFKTILNMNHGVCLLDDLLRQYEVRTGSRIDLTELGFTSVFDLIANLSDIMGMWRLGSGQFILYDLDNPPQSISNIPECAGTDSESPEHQQRNLSAETIDRLRRLVEVEYPGGLAIEELGLFGATLRDLDHEAYGYLTLEALLRNHPEVITVQMWGGAIRVMRDQSFVPPEERLKEAETRENASSGPQIPPEAVKPGSSYKCPDVKALMPPGEMVESGGGGGVLASPFLDDPARGADTLQALDALMDRMFEFYGSPIGGRYVVPNDFITIGFPVVALYASDLNFYRAIVTNLEDLTTLFFVDYGTICRCDYSSLRLLHRAFHKLPAQAIKATLCEVSPPGASRLWPRAASQRFLEMIQNKAFVAQIMASEVNSHVKKAWDFVM